MASPETDPMAELRGWIEEARAEDAPQPASAALVTVGSNGPSARTITVKRFERDALLFSTALWTRKAEEMRSEPRVALLFHWPTLGRQAHLVGRATRTERAVDEELWRERPIAHQLQAVISRQGETIEDLGPLREQLAHLAEVQETPPPCPDDWGAIRVRADAVELWHESDDRIHERRLFERQDGAWRVSLLSP